MRSYGLIITNENTLDVATSAGLDFAIKNNITLVPTIVLSNDAKKYPAFYNVFMQVAKDDGWEVCGFDVSQDALDVCRAKGLAVYENFDDIPKFDVVTVWNMIDHLENPREFLQKVISRLNDNGLLVLCTSTIDNWLYFLAHCLYKIGIKRPVELCYPVDHSTFFSTGALLKTMQRGGLDVFNHRRTDIGFFNTIFLPLIKKIDLMFNKYSLEKIFFAKL